MPEYPEVRTIADQINELTKNAQLLQFKVAKSLSTQVKSRALAIDKIINQGTKVLLEKTESKGKVIYTKMKVENSYRYIVSHLMLHGQWRAEKQKFSTFCIEFLSEGGVAQELWFGDSMRLGKIELLTQSEFNVRMQKLGVNVDKLTLGRLREITGGTSRKIADLLMDQSAIAGIGNYLRSEILYKAEIDPARKSNTLTNQETGKLLRAILSVINETYKKHGSLGKYVDVYGKTGAYKMKVYGKKFDSENHKVSILSSQGRKIYWVPTLQK